MQQQEIVQPDIAKTHQMIMSSPEPKGRLLGYKWDEAQKKMVPDYGEGKSLSGQNEGLTWEQMCKNDPSLIKKNVETKPEVKHDTIDKAPGIALPKGINARAETIPTIKPN